MRADILSNKKIEIIIEKLKKEGAKRIGIFGSYSRGEIKDNSDIDLLVEFSNTKSLLDTIRIERELEELLFIKIDLLTKDEISPYMIDSIKKEEIVLYG